MKKEEKGWIICYFENVMNWEFFGSFVLNLVKFGFWILNEFYIVDCGRVWWVCFIFFLFLMNCYVLKLCKVFMICVLI